MENFEIYCFAEKMKMLSIIFSSILTRYSAYLNDNKEPEPREIIWWILDEISRESSIAVNVTKSELLSEALELIDETEASIVSGNIEEAIRKIANATTRITTEADRTLRKIEEKKNRE
ncbi:MAG: hypothetical protein ACUVXA_02160 [Candidatus Jordarchaeum sp.]|uniref:hypothetical protein n=1 Tax=Candidatus Jordarchaeum sp. TaxID=2823881 RepID=UPI0040493146